MRINVHPSKLSNRPVHEAGATAAFDPEQELARMVSCCLLGENQFYLNGEDIAHRIFELACKCVRAQAVADIARNARHELGLRHVPLLLVCGLANRSDSCPPQLLRETIVSILRTPKDAMDLFALYWSIIPKGDRRRHAPIPYQFKRALRIKFNEWTEFQLRRYGTLKNVSVRLSDVMMLTHPNPVINEQPDISRARIFEQIIHGTVKAPETWESRLSRCTSNAQKHMVWTQLLLGRHRIGALALVRNLRKMESVGVSRDLVIDALSDCRAADVWPWQSIVAAREAPVYTDALHALMLRSAGALPRLAGVTGILVDVSGSMDANLSQHGSMTRMDAAAGLAVVLEMMCDHTRIASFSDELRLIPQHKGIALADAIVRSQKHNGTLLGGAVKSFMSERPIDRLVCITDEQSQDVVVWPTNYRVYVINLASYQRGLDAKGEFSRIHGWSGNVVRYIAEVEGSRMLASDEED